MLRFTLSMHTWTVWATGLLLALIISGCGRSEPTTTVSQPSTASETTRNERTSPALIDAQATTETQALYRNLHQLTDKGVLFGHQDTLAYGVEWWAEDNRSDIHDLTGSFPAVYGWDLGHLERGDAENLDGVNFEKMQHWIRTSFARGGINTLSWHPLSPVNGESSWDQNPTVKHLIPGGSHHEQFKTMLDSFVAFVEPLTFTAEDGSIRPIPLIFRPWHEHNGSWFWWGKDHTDEQDYITLWRFTVDYLRDEKGLHNLIYAFSPDRSRINLNNFEQDFLYGYPGDDYVDIIGIDNYWDLGHPNNPATREQQQQDLVYSLEKVAQIASQKNKLAAMTEGGQENLHEADFWTGRLLAALTATEDTRRIVYAQVWRNANRERESRDHYFGPFPGQGSAEDFQVFHSDPFTLFEDDLSKTYNQK